MNKRDEQIAAVRERSARLQEPQGRLDACYQEILRAYQSASIVQHLGRVVEEYDRRPSDFRVLSNSEARPLHQFTDTSFYWDMYCKELGRSVALAEEGYIFKELQKLPVAGEAISAANPSFGPIASAASDLRARGYTPDTLCAIIDLFVPFGGDKGLIIDWDSSPKEVLLLPDGARLKLFWSSGAAPLDRFVVLDSTRMIWKVKPDPGSGHRLTIAIGESRIATGEDAVVFLAETVAKFEVDAEAAVAIGLDGEPLSPEEYVRQEQLR